jgi:hypothetical protein
LFVLVFGQDWDLLFSSFHEGARRNFAGLPSERKEQLRRELIDFVTTHDGKLEREVVEAWLRLGAQDWPRNLDIRATLREFAAKN